MAILVSIPDKRSLLRLMARVPELLVAVSGVPLRRPRWRIDADMLRVSLDAVQGLYRRIVRVYESEAVLRWGVRRGMDMRSVFEAWTGTSPSEEFRDFHMETHPRLFDEEFGETLARALPFPEHLVRHITTYIVFRGVARRLPRNLPVRALVDGVWVRGTVRKLKGATYTIKLPVGAQKRSWT